MEGVGLSHGGGRQLARTGPRERRGALWARRHEMRPSSASDVLLLSAAGLFLWGSLNPGVSPRPVNCLNCPSPGKRRVSRVVRVARSYVFLLSDPGDTGGRATWWQG